MRLKGLEAIYKRPNTSKAHPRHPVYPYLLRKMKIDRPNQVWCADITVIPVRNGFLYLVTIMVEPLKCATGSSINGEGATRKVLSWRLSNTLHADFCIEAPDEAIAKFGAPGIMNTDQGSQFTGHEWTGKLSAARVKISMGLERPENCPVDNSSEQTGQALVRRGCLLDNIFIERLWRSLKQEAIYLEEISDGFHAKRIITNWMAFYNQKRPHSALAYQTPDEPYSSGKTTKFAA